MHSFFLIVLLTLATHTAAGQVREYVVDPESSKFEFQVEHFGVATVKGHFGKASGSIRFNQALPDSLEAAITIEVASINTNNTLRDRELRSEDFLDARRYPTVQFQSERVNKVSGSENNREVMGRMTLYGSTRSMTIPYTASVNTTSDQITIVSDFVLSRKAFNLKFGLLMDSLVGDEIKVSVSIIGTPAI